MERMRNLIRKKKPKKNACANFKTSWDTLKFNALQPSQAELIEQILTLNIYKNSFYQTEP